MNKIYFILLATLLANVQLLAQNQFASEVIVVNGEAFGTSKSNIASYNIQTKAYIVFDSLKTNSVQDILIEDSVAYVSAQNKIFSYNLNTKTKIAEANYPGASPSKGSLFIDDNHLFVGNWYGQSDSFLYALNKTNLSLSYSVTEATKECGGGLSLNDTLYIGQKIKGTVDACPPYGCFADSMGAIIVADANSGAYARTITLGESGAGVEQIYNEGDFLFAVCPASNKILKIALANDSIVEEISLAPFTKSLQKEGTKLYMDLNGKAGYYDLSDGSIALSGLDLAGVAIAYDANTETAFTTSTNYSSYGNLMVYDANNSDTVSIGVSPEAIALFYKTNSAPMAVNDEYEFVYDENTASYTLDVLANDNDPDGNALTISSVSNTNVSGASVNIANNKIEYNRALGIATTDVFSYEVCDNNGQCSSAIVQIIVKSLTSIQPIENLELTIYPNPATDVLYIKSNEQIEEIQFINTIGEVVKITKENKINLQNLPKGVFFVNVRTMSKVLTKRITVK